MTDKELVERLLDFDKVTVGDARDAALRIKALTAKLAKAVEGLHTISGHVVLNNENEEELSESALLARALLAEIEGDKP
jgi:hypothetical protein